MILYVISGLPRSGKTTLAKRLVGAAHVWDLDEAREKWQGAFLECLKANLLIFRRMVTPKAALDCAFTAEEVEAIRSFLPLDAIVHFHVVCNHNETVPSEAEVKLGLAADYAITWARSDG